MAETEIKITGQQAAERAKQGLQDMLGDMAKLIQAEAVTRAPVKTATLRGSIRTDPELGASETELGRFRAQVYTGPESKAYAAVQHEGVIRPGGEPIVVHEHTRRMGNKVVTVREHIRRTPIELHAKVGGKDYLRGPLIERMPTYAPDAAEKVRRRLHE